MFEFAFVLIFAALSGFIGAIICLKWSRPGWPRVLLGLCASAFVLSLFMSIQFALFWFLGDERTVSELVRTGLVLIAACAIFWGPAFALSYIQRSATQSPAQDAK